MSRIRPLAFILTAAFVGVTACNDSTAPDQNGLGSAFLTAPAGFNEVGNSFGRDDASAGLPWLPERGHGGSKMMGGRGGPGMGSFMGPGMGADFLGGVAAGRGPDRGPFAMDDDSNCTFSSATGEITCSAQSRNGMTITRVIVYKTVNGVVQQKKDSTTDYARVRRTANGTVTRRDGNVTATVQNSSDRTVTGLRVGSVVRTVTGTSSGTENATGKTRDGADFTSLRELSESTVGLSIPMQDGRPTYPTAGTVTRNMKVVMTSGGESKTSIRSEVITFNGSATASLTITHDGTTKTCTLPLPHGRPSCQ